MVQPFNPSKYLGKRLRENEIGKAYGLSSGKLNPWDLPEFETARQNMLAERDVGLSDLTRRLTQSGVEGPAAALSLEKAGNKYSSSLLDLANKLQGAFTDRGLTLGKQATDEVNNNYWKNIEAGLSWQRGHDARRAQPNDLMKTVEGVKGVTGALSEMAKFGLGGAAMMGWLPGMNGISSLAGNQSGLNGMNFMQLFDMMQNWMNQRNEAKAWGYSG